MNPNKQLLEDQASATDLEPSKPIIIDQLAKDGIVFSSVEDLKKPPVIGPDTVVINAEDIAFGGIRDLAQKNHLGNLTNECTELLDKIYSALTKTSSPTESVVDEISQLFYHVDQIRRQCTKEAWEVLRTQVILPHRVSELIHQDPCTYRSFHKPRGYAGDAVLMDFFYLAASNHSSETSFQQKLHNTVINRPAGGALRDRLHIVAKNFDRVVSKKGKVRALSIACGHLRELGFLQSSVDNIIELCALDQDKETLEMIKTSPFSSVITPINTSFISLIKKTNPLDLGTFDYVYSAGLFDYLSERTSKLLVEYMFKALNPGGTMLVANFMPKTEDIGYMESFMDWHLIYRSMPDYEIMTKDLPSDEIQEKRIFQGKMRNVLYLQIEKMAA